MSGLLIIGAGGHGKVAADTALAMGCWENIAFLDDRYESLRDVLGWKVLGGLDSASTFLPDYPDLVVAIGDGRLRVRLIHRFKNMGFSIPVIVHPTAAVSGFSIVGVGSVVFACAAINACARLGTGCIINTGATVDHDCFLEEGVHLSPGVHLAGEVAVGCYSWLGIGSSVIQGVAIGKHAMVGAGAVVLDNVPDNVMAAGVPARTIKKLESSVAEGA